MATATLAGPFLVGKNCTLLAIAPATSNAAGTTITTSTAQSLLGKFDGFEVQFTAETVNIKAANATYANEVIISDSFTARITEIIPANGTSLLLTDFAGFDYFQVSSQCAPTGGAGTAGVVLTLYGVRKSCSYQIVEGKNVAVLELGPCGIPPAYA